MGENNQLIVFGCCIHSSPEFRPSPNNCFNQKAIKCHNKTDNYNTNPLDTTMANNIPYRKCHQFG